MLMDRTPTSPDSPGLPGPPASSGPIHETGEQLTEARPGSLDCIDCGFAISTTSPGELPRCPNCGGDRFRRASIFRRPTVEVKPVSDTGATADTWLAGVRAALDESGPHLAFKDQNDEIQLLRLEPGWIRIGRAESADIRFDDATVSRRHALMALTPEGELRVLDDRSLNGLLVNGERVDSAGLVDGDELEIGRYRLHVLIQS